MKHKIKIIVALICALAIAATSTFAWGQIMTQKNEFWGRHKHTHLHDDFNPDTGKKDVYVENTGDTNIYIRVKLDETMIIGSHLRPDNPDWVTHTYDDGAPEDCGHGNTQTPSRLFHDYFTWTMGGSKWYLPATEPAADQYINGNVMQDTNQYNSSTPGAKETPNAAIITAEDFLALSETEQKAFIGWIYSTDGWAYWSQAVPPGEATGLLLRNVARESTLNNKSYYYAINVIAEAVDRPDAIAMWINDGDSVDKNDGVDKQAGETSDEGIEVIWIIIGDDGDPGTGPSVSINGGNRTISVGDEVQLTYTVTPPDFVFDPGDDVHWSTSNPDVVDVDEYGLITGVSVGSATIMLTIGEGADAISTLITITVTDGGGGNDLPVYTGPFTPITAPNPLDGDGYYAKHDFLDPTDSENNFVYHIGSIHLEDVISDGNYTGVTAVAAAPYTSNIFISNTLDQHGKPSIMYNYFPTNAQWIAQLGPVEMLIPVEVTLTRGSQSATVTINMIYPGCVVSVDMG